jgi:very-short-patch-repair endonuclease
MLIEVAPLETRRELDRLVTWGIRKGLLNLDEMRSALARGRWRPGLRKLKAALGAYLQTEDRQSDLERDFDALLAEHPEMPQPQRNIYINGWEVDCYWPEQKLAVELDGRPYHIAVRDIEKDKYKDAKPLIVGIRTMRITDARFNCDRAGVYDDLCAALGLG